MSPIAIAIDRTASVCDATNVTGLNRKPVTIKKIVNEQRLGRKSSLTLAGLSRLHRVDRTSTTIFTFSTTRVSNRVTRGIVVI
jgi:hypothetical protein